LGSDRASRRTLIALGEEPPRKERSLEGSGYLGRCCQRQLSVRQFLYSLEIAVKRNGQRVQKVATVATFVAMLQTTFYVGCRRRRRCRRFRHTYIPAQRKDSRTLNGATLDGNRGELLTSESRRGVHEV